MKGTNVRLKTLLLAAIAVLLAAPARAELRRTFAVNEYFGKEYVKEPVSFDVTFPEPVPRDSIGLTEGPWQVEVVEGTGQAVRKARVWTHVDFRFVEGEREVRKGREKIMVKAMMPAPAAQRHKLLTVVAPAAGLKNAPSTIRVAREGRVGKVDLATVSNGVFWARIPVGSVAFDPPASAFDLPGPVVSVSRDGKEWVGTGYLDTIRRVKAITCEVEHGPIYFESRIRYDFEAGRVYRSRVRVYANKPYARLVEDFDVGGASEFVLNYDEWFADAFFRTGDNRLCGWKSITTENPCADFVRIAGQEPLARMVIWSQFNYFGGKQETVALKAPDPKALDAAHVEALARYRRDLTRYEEQLERWRKDPKRRKPRKPAEPAKPEYAETVHTVAGAPIRATSVATPGGDSTAVGAFYVRPDRWTRAKVNHVDLYMRPEVPGDRMTRGVVGLAGARQRIALEAWLVDGHREWAIFAVRSGDAAWLAKAHVQEGVWPLDRLIRLPLVWNSDGSPVRPEHTKPSSDKVVGGTPSRVLLDTRGRSGLQTFNGSEGRIRGTRPRAEGWDGTVVETRAEGGDVNAMVDKAMTAYASSDESAYPSIRAMLPWTHPEALNPFYQGMENMNFNADLYRYVTTHGLRLARMGHPAAERFIDHGERSFDMALSRYVYPQSGCWEESHGYGGHTIRTVGPLALALKNSRRRNFLDDPRFARMLEFFLYVHSPVDAEFGNRIVPPVGDHGLSRGGPASRFKDIIKVFVPSKSPAIRRIVRQAAWMIQEDGGTPPEGIRPEKPSLRSRWLQGYGTVMRAFGSPVHALEIDLDGALVRRDRRKKETVHTLTLRIGRRRDGSWQDAVSASARAYNQASHKGTATVTAQGDALKLAARMDIGSDRWVKGGRAEYAIELKKVGDAYEGTHRGTFNGREVSGKATGRVAARARESFLVLRAGQSWGHHHADKGSMWFWGRDVHFFGDCAWGAPPGGTYWNKYKQGPASGTQIELVGVNNWTLPCKYPAPWIADDEYADAFDYALARCIYPYNPPLDLRRSSPVALRNGYDRQTLFVHPDVLIVRDTVETTCPAIWRLHSYQPKGTSVRGHRATLASPQEVVGQLAILHPASGVKLRLIDRDILNAKYFGDDGKPLPHDKLPTFGSSVELRWDMPPSTNATWVFAVHGKAEKPPVCESLDPQGRVTRVRLADGTDIIALLDVEPFRWSGYGIEFEGTVGLRLKDGDGRIRVHAVRSAMRATK